ncbi:MAG: molybdenum cofactor biosynthesis protein MoaE [Acidobacteriota bacterium]|nr:molybdenum cofactor biosynthesis protein MoaE [Blastocatellia bacterium]MDW8411459.1 molybdenum cofactor biosynthesis protein MoaE [Acidobacteriota bacterium]
MKVEVLLFGVCKELVGKDQLHFELPEGCTVSSAFEQVLLLHPSLLPYRGKLLFAVNETFANPEKVLSEGDTLALLPPVSGGSADIYELTREAIDTRLLVERLLLPTDGAVVTFEGVTRNHNRGKQVLYLEYEAYEAMAPKVMRQIADEARKRWQIDAVGIVHRLGRVDIGQTSVAIVVTSVHRAPAFEACRFLIDRLKQIVPIWKREYYCDGAVWVDPHLQ